MFNTALEPMQAKWQELSSRDQNSTILLMVALALTFIIFVVILPLKNTQRDNYTNLANANKVYSEILTLAPKALSQQSTKNPNLNVGSLNSEIRRQAARQGIVIQRFEPDGQRLKVWIEEARYPAIVKWLGALQESSIQHTELTMEDRPKPGLVSVRVTFEITGQ